MRAPAALNPSCYLGLSDFIFVFSILSAVSFIFLVMLDSFRIQIFHISVRFIHKYFLFSGVIASDVGFVSISSCSRVVCKNTT